MKKSLFTAFVVGLGLTASLWAQVPSYVPTNGLVGWWPFNGNANDESGNGNNGTVNGAMLTADRFENVDKAYSFDGNQNILVQHSNSFNMSSNFSISLWFTVNDFNNVRTLINKNSIGNGNLDYFNIGILPNSGILYTQFGDGNSTDNILCPNIPNLNLWYNAIFTVSDSVKFFVNGQLIESHLRTISPLENTENLSFGYWQTQSHTYHMGKLDDIGIWNRALTQQEITVLYNSCQGTSITSQPSNSTVTVGSSAQFSANAAVGSTYQWQSNPLNTGWLNLSNNSTYLGATTSTLTVTNASVSNFNQPFRAIVNSGGCIDTSNIATIQIADTCITNVTVYDTLLTTVTDTLIINTTLSLPAPNNENMILIYPNPVSDHITIDNGNFAAMAGYSIKITNNAGQQVFQSAIDQAQFYVDLSTWTGNGLYFVHLIDPQNNTVTVRKIVLQ